MKKETKNKAPSVKKPFYKNWIFWVILGVAVLFIGIGASNSEDSDTKKDPEPQAVEKSADNELVGQTGISKDELINACQDAKYYASSSYYRSSVKDIIDIWDSNYVFSDGAVTKSGKQIALFTWNGNSKNKEHIKFACYAMRNDAGEVFPVMIRANSQDEIWKTYADLEATMEYE